MATMQSEFGSAYNVPTRSRSGPEYSITARFPAESRAQRQTPSAETHFRSLQSDPYAPTEQPVVRKMLRKRGWVAWIDPNTPSSSEASADDAYRRFHAPESGWLADALAELAEVDDEIAEEELPPVDEATKKEAERILKALAWHPFAPTVYPMQDAEIALHFKAPGRSGTVVILLNNRGQADCHAYVDGRSRRAHYNSSSDLPDAFVLDQLRRLTPPGRGAAVSAPDAGLLQFETAFLPTNLLQTR